MQPSLRGLLRRLGLYCWIVDKSLLCQDLTFSFVMHFYLYFTVSTWCSNQYSCIKLTITWWSPGLLVWVLLSSISRTDPIVMLTSPRLDSNIRMGMLLTRTERTGERGQMWLKKKNLKNKRKKNDKNKGRKVLVAKSIIKKKHTTAHKKITYHTWWRYFVLNKSMKK